MATGGISRSGRVRKKSAKLMEMETGFEDGGGGGGGEAPLHPHPSAPAQPQKVIKTPPPAPTPPPSNKKMNASFDESDDDLDDDDSEPEKIIIPEKKVTPIRIPKAPPVTSPPNVAMLPVKKRPNKQTPSPVQKMTKVQPPPNIKTKIQPLIAARIGILPAGSSSSSSSSESSSTTTTDSSDSNSEEDIELIRKATGVKLIPLPSSGPMMKAKPMPIHHVQPPKTNKKKPPLKSMMGMGQAVVPKIMHTMPMHHLMASSGTEGSEPMLSPDDLSDDSSTTSTDSSDPDEVPLRIVEEPIAPPKKKKVLIKKKEVQRKPVKKMSNKAAAAQANAAAAVLASLGNPSAHLSPPPMIPMSPPPKATKAKKVKVLKGKKPKPLKPKVQRKKEDPYVRKNAKKTRPMTAYMLWCQTNRKKIVSQHPNMGTDFSMISKKMGEVWQSLHDKEKMAWKRKAKKLANKRLTFISTGKPSNLNLKMLSQSMMSPSSLRNSDDTHNANYLLSPHEPIRPNDTSPIDVAAHLKLLGESLSIIGQRLTEHEGQIAVSGSLSVLLDSTLCALGPLLCLTAQVEPLNGCLQEVLGSTLDNVAYIMPGL